MIKNLKDLKKLSALIRKDIVEMTHRGESSHVGSGLSIADILAVLYGEVLNVEPENPKMKNRDRFILSKGHAGAAVYSALAQRGFFPKKNLEQHYQNGSIFSGHVSHKGIPGVELSTGSLGHGLGVGCGIAKAAILKNEFYKVFVLLSDGELDEGSNWEAILFASHHKLRNLVAIIDYNKIQSLDSVSNTLELEPLKDKFVSFGWKTYEVDGHSHEDLIEKFNLLKDQNLPTVFICHTTKGKGVSFMEDSVLWHYRSPQEDEYLNAIKELNKTINDYK